MPKSSWNSVLKLHTHYLPNGLSPCWSYWIQICIVLSYERITESLEKTVFKHSAVTWKTKLDLKKFPNILMRAWGQGAEHCPPYPVTISTHKLSSDTNDCAQIVKGLLLCQKRKLQLATVSFDFWDFGVDISWQNINSEVKRAKQKPHWRWLKTTRFGILSY